MAVVAAASGTGTTITQGAGETALVAAQTTAGVYQLVIDFSNVVNGDIVELAIYDVARSGGTQRLCFHAVYAHAQAENIKVSPPMMVTNSWRPYVNVTDIHSGTTIAFDWEVRRG